MGLQGSMKPKGGPVIMIGNYAGEAQVQRGKQKDPETSPGPSVAGVRGGPSTA